MAFNLSEIGNTMVDSVKQADSLRRELGDVMEGAQTIEGSTPAAQFTMQHNLYDLLGDAVINSLEQGRFDSNQVEGYFKDLLNLQFILDFENRYGMKFQTGPSERSPGTRDFNLQITRDF